MTTILHGGFHKTGTTALQDSLARYRSNLAQRGLIYPDFSRLDPEIQESGHFFFASSLARGTEDCERISEFLAEESQRGETLFLSAESMLRYALPDQACASRRAGKIAYLERVRSVLPKGETISLLTLRNPFRLIESYYQEYVKKTFSDVDFSDYMNKFFNNYDPLTTLSIWKSVFGAVELRSYEADCEHPQGISGAILEQFCSDFIMPEPPARFNTSLSSLAVDMLRCLNPRLKADGLKAEVLPILIEISRDDALKGVRTFWTRDLLAVAVPKLRRDFEMIADEFDAKDDLVFSPATADRSPVSRDTVLTAASRLSGVVDAITLQDMIEKIAPSCSARPMRPISLQKAFEVSKSKASQLGSELSFGDRKSWPAFRPSFGIRRSDKIFPIGSCFARNIEDFLVKLDLDVPTAMFQAPKEEWAGRPSGILNKYTPPAIRQAVEWAAGIYSRDDCLRERDLEGFSFRCRDGRVVDLQLASFVPVETRRHIQRRAQIYDLYRQLFNSDIVTVTLGLTEAWYDKETENYIDAAPNTRELLSARSRFELHNLTVEQSVRELRRAFDLVFLINPKARIILTTSPVPLLRSFTHASQITANTYSKSTLRSACTRIIDALPDEKIVYFPSYEIVSNSRSWDFWQRDLQHIKSGGVAQIVQYLVTAMIPDLSDDERDWLSSFAYSSQPERKHALECARALAARTAKPEHLEHLQALEDFEKQALAERNGVR